MNFSQNTTEFASSCKIQSTAKS